MKITNKNNLPESIYNFLKMDLYDGEKNGNSYSATELLKPTQEILLTRKHWKDIEVEASGRLWSLFGQGVHAVLEKEEGTEPIERLYAELEGKKISGKFDRIKNNVLYDFKVTSAITLVYNSREQEWTDQLSIYRWLYWKSKGKELSEVGRIIAILRDWSDKETKDSRYPKGPVVEIELKLKSLGNTEEMLRRKLKELENAQAHAPGYWPFCTDEERWWNPKKQTFMKCAKYCVAFKFCKQAQEIFSEPILKERFK